MTPRRWAYVGLKTLGRGLLAVLVAAAFHAHIALGMTAAALWAGLEKEIGELKQVSIANGYGWDNSLRGNLIAIAEAFTIRWTRAQTLWPAIGIGVIAFAADMLI